MTQSRTRLGVDIGGTFTDVVLDVADTRFSTKVLTTYAAPEHAIIEGMQQVCRKAGIPPANSYLFLHGTTLANYGLFERRGDKTGWFTTVGFGDVIEMRP